MLFIFQIFKYSTYQSTFFCIKMHLLKSSMNREVKKKMTHYKNSTMVKTGGKKGWQLGVRPISFVPHNVPGSSTCVFDKISNLFFFAQPRTKAKRL